MNAMCLRTPGTRAEQPGASIGAASRTADALHPAAKKLLVLLAECYRHPQSAISRSPYLETLTGRHAQHPQVQ
jgi:hypothetical protein